MRRLLLSAGIITLSLAVQAQATFYDPAAIQKIEIQFAQSNWDYILDTAKAGAEGYLMAQWVKVNGVRFDSAGVKYKGNSSYAPSRTKNPFHIKLDKYKNQNYQNFTDIKLANGFYDPSMIREALAYDILQKYMHCSRANFAQVYVNSTYIGLYTNDEDINKTFCKDHFYGAKKNSFIQGNPPAGGATYRRSNLKYLGADSTLYFTRYELESDTGWNDLVKLCDTLLNAPASLGNKMDMDRAIWMMAFNNVLVNLDSYLGDFVQNYYLFKDNTGHYNPIVWDLNMAFAVFMNIGGGGGTGPTALQQLSPTVHGTDAEWPLVKAIMANPMWKKMYIAHMRTMAGEMFTGSNPYYQTRAAQLQAVIDTVVQNDPNKFYTYAQFQAGMNAAFGPGIPMGISTLMTARVNYLQSTTEFMQTPPLVLAVASDVTAPANNTTVVITTKVTNTAGGAVYLGYRFDSTLKFTRITMYDDGIHGDSAANDNIYGASLNVTSQHGQYYIYAENAAAGIFSPQRAEHEFHSLLTQPVIIVTPTTTGVGPNAGGNTALGAFPNPADHALNIVTGNSLPVAISVTDAMGQVVYKGDVQDRALIATSAWAAGVYFIHAGTASLKVVVAH